MSSIPVNFATITSFVELKILDAKIFEPITNDGRPIPFFTVYFANISFMTISLAY